MSAITLSGEGSVAGIAGLLRDEIVNSGLSCELVGSVSRGSGEYRVETMVFEKYYMRAGNRASLTVVVSGAGNRVTVDAIGSGGGQGPVFRFSWGVEDSFAETVADILRPHGFR